MNYEETVSSFSRCCRFINGDASEVLLYAGRPLGGLTEPKIQFALSCFRSQRLWVGDFGREQFEVLQEEMYGDTDDDWGPFWRELQSALQHLGWAVELSDTNARLRAVDAESPYEFRLTADHTQHGAWSELLVKQLLSSGTAVAEPVCGVNLDTASQAQLVRGAAPEQIKKTKRKAKKMGWKPAQQPKRRLVGTQGDLVVK